MGLFKPMRRRLPDTPFLLWPITIVLQAGIQHKNVSRDTVLCLSLFFQVQILFFPMDWKCQTFCHCQKESGGTFWEPKSDLFGLFLVCYWYKYRFMWTLLLRETFFSYYKNTIKLFVKEECVSLQEYQECAVHRRRKNCRGNDANLNLFLSSLFHLLCLQDQMWN